MSPFWIVFFSILGGISAVTGIVWFVWWLVERQPNKKKEEETQKILLEMRGEIKKLREQGKETQFYLDGIPEVRDKRKALIYRDAFRAMREYRHAEAIAKFQEALPLASDDSERCAILNLIGNSQTYYGLHKEAENTFLEMASFVKQTGINEQDFLVVAFNNIGWVNQLLGKHELALEYHLKALEAVRQIHNETSEGKIISNIGIDYQEIGDFDKAQEYYAEALKIAKRSDDFESQARVLGNMGIFYQKQGKMSEALEYYEKALKIAVMKGYLKVQAIQLHNIGLVLAKQKKYEESLTFLTSSRELYLKIGSKYMVEKTDNTIARIKRKLAVQGNPPSPP